MKYGINDKLWQDIVITLKNMHFIKKIILFGSRARGDYKYNSDIDLAIDVESHNDLLQVIRLLDELKCIYKFDVVNINKISNDKLLANINKEGIIILEK